LKVATKVVHFGDLFSSVSIWRKYQNGYFLVYGKKKANVQVLLSY